MKVLVTGAYGFIGRNVVHSMSAAGHSVVGIGHDSSRIKDTIQSNLVSWHRASITLGGLITYAGEPDVIVHCAGSASVGFSVAHPYEDYERTVPGTVAVLEYMRLYCPKAVLVYPSSAAVYGVAQSLPLHETDPLSPASPYGVHKSIAEQMCQSYAATFGLAIAIVRFFSIYGEGLRKQLLWDACMKLMRGENTFSGTGSELRDWLHVEDAASLICCAVRRASSTGPVANGGYGQGVSVREVLTAIFDEFGASGPPIFSGLSRPGDPEGYQADITGAQSWGWNPCVPWREGVARYVRWFKRDQT